MRPSQGTRERSEKHLKLMEARAVSIMLSMTAPATTALLGPVAIDAWAEDEEFGIHPYGTKAKRTMLCPADPDHPLLIPGHRYLFKQAEDWKAQQMWSEAVAYQIGAAVGLPVPPCFIAVDGRTGQTGALIEFFYGYPDQLRADRLGHGADLLQGAGLMDGSGQPHAISVNLAFCERAGIPDAADWWAAALTFDALIGNTDRHSQNWGFLFSGDGAVRMAPVFDNGTSLAYQLNDGKIDATLLPAALERFVSRGRHSADWDVADPVAFNHVGLCAHFAAEHPEAVATMRGVLSIADDVLEGFLQDCTAIDVAPRFSAKRARLIAALVGRRRDLLLDALGRFE